MKKLIVFVGLLIVFSGFAFSQSVTITNPSGAVSWALNSTHTIQWTYGGAGDIMIQLFQSGSPVGTIYNGANSGNFSWKIDKYLNGNPIATGSYKIRVRSKNDSSIYDEVDLTITNGGSPSGSGVTITVPSAPVTWALNSTHTIQWTYGGAGDIMIQLFQSGSAVGTVYNGANSGSFSWKIDKYLNGNPIAAGNYKIRVRSKNNSSIYDEVDLTIPGGPPSSKCNITFTEFPTTAYRGKYLNIKWSYSGCTDHGTVSVYIKKVTTKYCSNSLRFTPVYWVSTSGSSISWSIPKTIEKGLYKVRIIGPNVNTILSSSCIHITDFILPPDYYEKFLAYRFKPIKIPEPEPGPWWRTRVELGEVFNALKEIGVTTDFGETRGRFGIVLTKGGHKISLVNFENGRTKWLVKHEGESAVVSLSRFATRTKRTRLSTFNASGLKIQIVNLETGEVLRSINVEVER